MIQWQSFNKKIYRSRYRLLLYALLLTVFGDLFFPIEDWIYYTYFRPLWLLLTVLAGWNLVHRNRQKNLIYKSLLIILTIGELINIIIPLEQLNILKQLAYLVFFITFSLELFHQVRSTTKVSSSIITAVLCGLIILGIAGGIGAMIIESVTPDSFEGNLTGDKIADFQYFSFITLTTVGFGDIIPVTVYAKKYTILMTLIGNFYSIVIVGIIIGKFTSSTIKDEEHTLNKLPTKIDQELEDKD
ncbi:potassium channel family protein [Halosquirtibacter xylanolyticus]|uniref:potassium channel family protein n=1 Tax=Halosquirtibacter xylanolyticus TaxID=3374599 RepID=UPI003748D090|nr:potassium channel family protein [Prolixibacteraceae bacterium]